MITEYIALAEHHAESTVWCGAWEVFLGLCLAERGNKVSDARRGVLRHLRRKRGLGRDETRALTCSSRRVFGVSARFGACGLSSWAAGLVESRELVVLYCHFLISVVRHDEGEGWDADTNINNNSR